MPLQSFTPNTVIQSSKVNSNFSGLADGSLITNATIDALKLTNIKAVSGLYDNGNSGTSKTIDWSNGDRQKLTISGNVTISYSNAIAGQILTLELVENATGNFTITLPTSKWPNGAAGVFTTTANAKNLLVVFYDGTDYLTQLASGFA